jgi:CheY-like chemotaxis protein
MRPNGLFRKRILLVENNPRLREAIRLLLCLEGHTVTEAENGRRACHLFAPGDFDLVITEHTMPVMPGDELARTLKCLVPSQPILMIASAASMGPIPNSAIPVDGFLQKPFKFAELRRIVATLLSAERPNVSLFRGCGASLKTPVRGPIA